MPLVVFSSFTSAPIICTKNIVNKKNGKITIGNTVVIIIDIFSSVLFFFSSNHCLLISIVLYILLSSSSDMEEFLIASATFVLLIAFVITWLSIKSIYSFVIIVTSIVFCSDESIFNIILFFSFSSLSNFSFKLSIDSSDRTSSYVEFSPRDVSAWDICVFNISYEFALSKTYTLVFSVKSPPNSDIILSIFTRPITTIAIKIFASRNHFVLIFLFKLTPVKYPSLLFIWFTYFSNKYFI